MKIMKEKASRNLKRKAEAALSAGKRRRSSRPRQRRAWISPVVIQSSIRRREGGISATFVDSSYGSFLEDDDNVSCGSSRVENSSSSRKRSNREVEASGSRIDVEETIGDPTFRRITRSYSKLKKERKREKEMERKEVEVSESSCVDSYSGADFVLSSLKVRNENEDVKGFEDNENDEVSFTRSDVTFAEHVSDARNLKFSSENKENEVVSFSSGAEICSGPKFGSVSGKADDEGFQLSDISIPKTFAKADFTLGWAMEQKPKLEITGCVSDLACKEELACDNVSEYSENAISELKSEIFPEYSDLDSSDYTPSIFFDSGSEFSEKSCDDSPPSQTYALFLEFKEQFCRWTNPNIVKSPCMEEDCEIQPGLQRFEYKEEEESYQRLRERERRLVCLQNHAEDYCSRTEHGDLVAKRRLRMVQWIVQQCSEKELQQETMFLGVSLLDRFLSKGFFKSERNLMIVGIACLALATRMEENQPYNIVRQRNFYIENKKLSRCEVVAMEWLVQEVLNFRCFSPTIYNFLGFYLKAAKANAEVEKKAKYLAVMALSDHSQLFYRASSIAAGLVILASIENNLMAAYRRVIEVHVRTKDNELPECVKVLQIVFSVKNSLLCYGSDAGLTFLTEPGVVAWIVSYPIR